MTIFEFQVHAISLKKFLASRLFPNAHPAYSSEILAHFPVPLPNKPIRDMLIGDITPLSEWLCEHHGPDAERRDRIWYELTDLLYDDEVDAGATRLFRSQIQATYFLELMDPAPELIPPPGTLNLEGKPFRHHPRLAPDDLVDYWCGSGEQYWQSCRLIPRALVPWFFGLLKQALAHLKALDIPSYDDLIHEETPWYVDEFTECVASIEGILRCDEYDFLAITIRW